MAKSRDQHTSEETGELTGEQTGEAGRGRGSPTGKERRCFPRAPRKIVVSFTYEGEEFLAQTMDVSKTGALLAARQAPSVGTQILLTVTDPRKPAVALYVKADVIRHLPRPGGGFLFGVTFREAISQEPRLIRKFLESLLGIVEGVVRVVGTDEGGERRYSFSFEPVQQEGKERVKAIQSALFRDLAEMEEADQLLANFGKPAAEKTGEGRAGPDQAAPAAGPDPAAPAAAAPPAAGPTSWGKGSEESTQEMSRPRPGTLAAAPISADSIPTRQMAAIPDADRFSAEVLAAASRRIGEPAPAPVIPKPTTGEMAAAPASSRSVNGETTGVPPASPKTTAGTGEEPNIEMKGHQTVSMKVPTRVDKGLIASISRLLGGKPKGKKGEALLSPEPLPTLVSKDAQLPIVFRVGTNRFQGKAVRLYCAGLKCTTDQKLPPLYASVTIFIPLSGNRKVSQIEVLGDVTRVKPEGADTENNGLFEVRLSMRTDKVHLELYRALLESMSK